MKRVLALVGTAGIVAALGVASATAAPKSDPANCVGKVVSAHTSNGLASGSALVNAAKASCRDGIPFHTAP